MNGYKSTELQQQMLEMRDDPTMPYHSTHKNPSTYDDKDSSGIDCSSLSSEIFLATRLLHDETLDSTTLTMDEPEESSSPYNNGQLNRNNYCGNPVQNDASSHQNTINSVGGLNQQETLDSDFLFSDFGQFNTNRPDTNYDEYTNKSWLEPSAFSEIMPSPVRTISKNNIAGKKFKGERRRKPLIKKDLINVTKHKLIREIQTQVSIEKVPEISLPLNNDKPSNNENQIKVEEINIKQFSPTISNQKSTIYKPNLQRFNFKMNNFKMNYTKEIPTTSDIKIQYVEGRKVPNYLSMFKLKDDRYSEVFACKHCFGIFTTLDSAIFHPCIKKRRGRKPKILEDCLVPL